MSRKLQVFVKILLPTSCSRNLKCGRVKTRCSDLPSWQRYVSGACWDGFGLFVGLLTAIRRNFLMVGITGWTDSLRQVDVKCPIMTTD